MKKIEMIVTHERPHIDEICAIWLLLMFGEEKFPGIKEAKITFAGMGGEEYEGLNGDQFESVGILFLGVGAGRFDEHPGPHIEAKKGECVSTLIAKKLGVEDNPALEKILKLVFNNDVKGVTYPGDLASIVKALHSQYREKPDKAMNWAMAGLEAMYKEQLGFWGPTKKEFEEKARIEKIPGPIGRTLTIVAIVSDNEQMNKFARSSHGVNASIIIQQQPSGNVQIYTNKKDGLVLYDVVQILRITEQETKGKLATTDWNELSREGKIEGAEEWYFHEQGQMLLNGSLSAPNVPPTKIPLERIKDIVRIGVNPNAFEPNRAPQCQKGTCSSTMNNPCPWYKWGIHRCRKIRYEIRQR